MLLAKSLMLNSKQIQGLNLILLLLLVATLSIIQHFGIVSRVTQNHKKRPMGINNMSLLNRKLFLSHGLSTLAQQDTQFASILLNDMLSTCVGKSRVETGSTTSLDDIQRSSYQGHQDLIPNVLEPSIGLLFKNTLMSSWKLSQILASLQRTYTIWTRRVVSGVVERMGHAENTSIHVVHVQSTNTKVRTLNLLLSLNVFRQMERISCLDSSSKVSNMTQSGLKLTAESYMYCLLAVMPFTDARFLIALVFLQTGGQMTFYALNGLRSPSFLRLLHRIHQGSQLFSSMTVMDPIILQNSFALPGPIISFCSASHLTQPTNYNPLMSVYLDHFNVPGLSNVRRLLKTLERRC